MCWDTRISTRSHVRKKQTKRSLGRSTILQEAYDIALNGDGASTLELLQVIEQYKGTRADEFGLCILGLCFAHLGEPAQALEHLQKFKAIDVMVAPAITGAVGDCYVELDKLRGCEEL